MSDLTGERRRLKVELVGAQETDGAVRLDAFHKFIQQLIQTLAAVETEVSPHPKSVTIYRVIGLSYNSPATLELEAVPASPSSPDLGPKVVPRIAHHFDAIRRGVTPEGVEYRTLEGVQAISGYMNKYFREITFTEDRYVVPVEKETEVQVKKMLANVYRSLGTIRGRLEAVNLHSSPSTATIYPVVGASKVRCVFKKGSFPRIGDYLDRAVDAEGVLKYHGDSPYPFEIELSRLTALPPSDTLPRVEEIMGSMPDITEGLTVVEFLRKRRHEEAA